MYIFYHISLISLYNEKYFRQICRGNQNTYSMFKKVFFLLYCRLCGNVENYCRAGQATDDYMGHICWIPKATTTLSEYVILLLFHCKIVALTHLNVTLYTHCLSCSDLSMKADIRKTPGKRNTSACTKYSFSFNYEQRQ